MTLEYTGLNQLTGRVEGAAGELQEAVCQQLQGTKTEYSHRAAAFRLENDQCY